MSVPATLPPAESSVEEQTHPDAGIDLDALAALGTGALTRPQDTPIAVAPGMARTGGGGRTGTGAIPKPQSPAGGGGQWMRGVLAALNPSKKTIDSREQALATFWIYTTFLIGGGLTLLAVCWHFQNAHEAFMKVAQQTVGTVTSRPTIYKPNRGKLNPDRWSYRFDVAYSAGSERFERPVSLEGDALPDGFSADDVERWVGKTLPVYFDPTHPTDVKAVTAAQNATWTWGYVLGAACILIGVYSGTTRWPY